MDAAVFFLLVFAGFIVVLTVALCKLRVFGRDLAALKRDVNELRGVVLASARVTQDVASDVVNPLPQPDPDVKADLQDLMSNPLVQSLMREQG